MANMVRSSERRLRLLAVSARGHVAQGVPLVARRGPSCGTDFGEAPQETSQNARALMLRDEEMRIPRSKEANFCHTFYRIFSLRWRTWADLNY